MTAITIDSADLERIIEDGIVHRHSSFILLNRLRDLNGKQQYENRSQVQRRHSSEMLPAQRALNIALNEAREQRVDA